MKKLWTGIFLSWLMTVFHIAFAEPWTLSQSIEYALQHSPSYESSKYQHKITGYQKREAFAGFLPKVTASGTYARLDKVPRISFPTPAGNMDIEMGKQDNYNYQLSVQQPVFMGGIITNSYRMAGQMLQAQQELTRKAKQNLVLEVKKAFYNVLRANWFLAATDTSLRQLRVLEKQTRLMYQQGMATEANYLKVKAQAASVKLMHLQAGHAKKIALESFKNTIGMTEQEEVELSPELPEKSRDRLELKNLIELAREKDPDLKALQFQTKVAGIRVNMERAKYLPSLMAVWSQQWKNPTSANQSEFESGWTISLVANMTLWDWTASQQKVRQVKLQAKQAAVGLKQLQQAMVLKATVLHNQCQEAEEKVAVTEQGLAAAERGYRLSLESYHQGMMSQTEMLEAQRQATQAKADYYNAMADREIAWASLEYLLGQN